MIRCEGLVFEYADGTRALDGLDLAIKPGERVAIVGRNGSGKSTLVRHWNGLLRPTAGRVLVGGAPTAGRRVAEIARTVALTFQDPDRQLFGRTCRREVEFGARNAGLRGRELDGTVEAALGVVGLGGRADANPYDLGASRRRLLALASVLAMGTPVVVLDEPTMGLDGWEVERVAAIVAQLADAGRTVVAISHDPRFVTGSFERAVRLDAGRVVADGRPDEVVGSLT
ncbi:MAG TPA: ABC transporter ATP-binding protein [Candidatus Limnocylindria bacterium]|nr:ABC transporter ATP-binding protein [Candidatus Limnocylindria bacterium]